VGVLVFGSALLEAFAVHHLLHGGNEALWRFAVVAVPLFAAVLWTLARRSVPHIPAEQIKETAPDAELERKLAALADCPSVANKIAAADELMRCGRYEDSVQVYESALAGVYANEPDFLFKLAQAQIEANHTAAGAETVRRLMNDHARFRPEETRLLRARILEGQGRVGSALAEYETLTSLYVGFEAKCRYGLLLMREGRIERANHVFSQMVRDAEKSSYAMRTERHWLRVAEHCRARLQSKLVPANR